MKLGSLFKSNNAKESMIFTSPEQTHIYQPLTEKEKPGGWKAEGIETEKIRRYEGERVRRIKVALRGLRLV
jgi:hypothetical protein